MGVPEIGGQDGQAPSGILTIAIPAQQSLHSKSVSKIVQARAPAGIDGTQSNLPGQGIEGAVDLAFVQLVAVLVYEEVALGARVKAAVPAFHIICQDLTSRGMQRHQPGLSKLGTPNRENACGAVHVLSPKMQRLTEPQAVTASNPNRQ